jgi:hypothetical protein
MLPFSMRRLALRPRNQRYLQEEVVEIRRPLRFSGGVQHRRQVRQSQTATLFNVSTTPQDGRKIPAAVCRLRRRSSPRASNGRNRFT